MKKILIISYFYPPCNLTASQRVSSWAKYLSQFGYYPVVITRNWDVPINTPSDVLQPTGSNIKHEVFDTHEVYYLPYEASLRDKLFISKLPLSGFLSKALTFGMLIGQNVTNKAIPYSNIYSFAYNYLKNHTEINKVIISANPFEQFRFGYLLQKKLGIKWVADYRDDWNTTELPRPQGIYRLIHPLEALSEQKWVSTANAITSVSPYYTQKISDFTNVAGVTILNGFEPSELPSTHPDNHIFTIVYNGTLYNSQPIEVFIEGVKSALSILDKPADFHIYFPGLAFSPEQEKRVRQLFEGFESFVTITNRVPKKEIMTLQAKAHVLLMVAHKGLKGIPSSKVFEYIGLRKPVLLCPSDGDILEQLLTDCDLALIAKNANEVADRIINTYQMFKSDNKLLKTGNEKINEYTRRGQAKKLAKLLDKI